MGGPTTEEYTMLRIYVILSVFIVSQLANGHPISPGVLALLGNGYNILWGNPDGDFMSGDPGLLKNLFEVSSDIQDLVEFDIDDKCDYSSTTVIFEGAKSYQNYLKNFVTIIDQSEAFSGYEFSKSAKFLSMSASMEESNHVFLDDVTTCQLGKAKAVGKPVFSRDFVRDVCSLPATFHLYEYMKFMDTWGTHVITQVNVGSKVTRRYETTYKNLVKLARSLGTHLRIDGDIVSLDMDDMKKNLDVKPDLFGDIVETLTAGDEAKFEPISIGLMGIDEVVSLDYWRQMDRYVSEGLCREDVILNLRQKILNLQEAMRVYPRWHEAQISLDPVIQTTITWPTGTYGLPMTNSLSGCPNSAFYWMTGRRYQDTEDLFPSNEWSNPCHLLGPYAKNNMQQNFCTKTQAVISEEDKLEWDAGEYCIFKKGACPTGFTEGWIKWDDQDILNSNTVSGELPDGVYDHNTLIYYC